MNPKILNKKIFITSEEQDFINQLWADSLELSYVSDDTNFWESPDADVGFMLQKQSRPLIKSLN